LISTIVENPTSYVRVVKGYARASSFIYEI